MKDKYRPILHVAIPTIEKDLSSATLLRIVGKGLVCIYNRQNIFSLLTSLTISAARVLSHLQFCILWLHSSLFINGYPPKYDSSSRLFRKVFLLSLGIVISSPVMTSSGIISCRGRHVIYDLWRCQLHDERGMFLCWRHSRPFSVWRISPLAWTLRSSAWLLYSLTADATRPRLGFQYDSETLDFADLERAIKKIAYDPGGLKAEVFGDANIAGAVMEPAPAYCGGYSMSTKATVCHVNGFLTFTKSLQLETSSLAAPFTAAVVQLTSGVLYQFFLPLQLQHMKQSGPMP